MNNLTKEEQKSYDNHLKYIKRSAIEHKQEKESSKRWLALRKENLERIKNKKLERRYYSNFTDRWLEPISREEFESYEEKEVELWTMIYNVN